MTEERYNDLCEKYDEIWKVVGESLDIENFSYDDYLELVVNNDGKNKEVKDKLTKADKFIDDMESLMEKVQNNSLINDISKCKIEFQRYYAAWSDFRKNLKDKDIDENKFIEYRNYQFITEKFKKKNSEINFEVKYDNKGNCYIETNGKIDEISLPNSFGSNKNGSILWNGMLKGKKKIEIRENVKSKDQNQDNPEKEGNSNQKKTNPGTSGTSKRKSNKYNRKMRRMLNWLGALSLGVVIIAIVGGSAYATAMPLGVIAIVVSSGAVSITSLIASLKLRAKEKKNVNKKDGKAKNKSKLLSKIKKRFGKVFGKNRTNNIDETNLEALPDNPEDEINLEGLPDNSEDEINLEGLPDNPEDEIDMESQPDNPEDEIGMESQPDNPEDEISFKDIPDTGTHQIKYKNNEWQYYQMNYHDLEERRKKLYNGLSGLEHHIMENKCRLDELEDNVKKYEEHIPANRRVDLAIHDSDYKSLIKNRDLIKARIKNLEALKNETEYFIKLAEERLDMFDERVREKNAKNEELMQSLKQRDYIDPAVAEAVYEEIQQNEKEYEDFLASFNQTGRKR